MPQMAPMWWSTLFIMFLLCYTMTMMISYYTLEMQPSSESNNMSNEIKTLNWSW